MTIKFLIRRMHSFFLLATNLKHLFSNEYHSSCMTPSQNEQTYTFQLYKIYLQNHKLKNMIRIKPLNLKKLGQQKTRYSQEKSKRRRLTLNAPLNVQSLQS